MTMSGSSLDGVIHSGESVTLAIVNIEWEPSSCVALGSTTNAADSSASSAPTSAPAEIARPLPLLACWPTAMALSTLSTLSGERFSSASAARSELKLRCGVPRLNGTSSISEEMDEESASCDAPGPSLARSSSAPRSRARAACSAADGRRSQSSSGSLHLVGSEAPASQRAWAVAPVLASWGEGRRGRCERRGVRVTVCGRL